MRQARNVAVALVLVLTLAGAVGAWLWWRRDPGPAASAPASAPVPVEQLPPGIVGKWHPARKPASPTLSDDQRKRMQALEALSYLGGYHPAPTTSSVTLHRKDRAFQGYNLYFSGHGPEAALMDMDGRVLHTWRLTYDEARAQAPSLRKPQDQGPWSWRRGQVLASGDLLTIFEGYGLIKIDAGSRLLWAFPKAAHHDLAVAYNDDVYVLTRSARIVTRIHPKEPVVLDYISVLSSEGRLKREIAIYECFENSKYKHFLKKCKNEGDILHTNTIEVFDGRLAKVNPIFKAGNLLISVLYLDLLAIVDPDQSSVVWATTGSWKRQHEPILLEENAMLLFDNQGLGAASRVMEFDPTTLQIRWEYRGDKKNPFYSAECGTSYRLPNGNTLINESLFGRSFEVTADKTIVWEFLNPHRAGKDGQLIATLFDLVRLPPDFPLSWAKPPSGTHKRSDGTKAP